MPPRAIPDRAEKKRALQAQMVAWRNDPGRFAREAFTWHEPWGAELRAKFPKMFAVWQDEAWDALGRGERRLSVVSANGVGKTAWLGITVLWFVLLRLPNKCPITANREDQLSDVVWAEIRVWWQRLRPGLRDMLEVTGDRVSWKSRPAEGFAVARTARKEAPEAFQGFHAKHLLFGADEASGVHNRIFEVGKGSMSTPGAVTLLLGNGTRASGYFYDTQTKFSDRWWTRSVSAFEVIEEGCPWMNPHYPDEMAEEYGAESNVYRVRVLGQFPTSDDNAVIPRDWIADSVGRDIKATGDEVWGLDVARFGDDRSALIKRRGNAIPEPAQSWKKLDTMTVAGHVKREWDEAVEKPVMVYVDPIGIGAGVADRLRELGLPITEVNVAETAPDQDRFIRLRDELWWRTREWFHGKDVCIPDDGVLIGELGDVHYDILSSGKLKVETKDEMKKRGVRSPDVADALVMTFAAPQLRWSEWQAPIQFDKFYPQEAFA